MYGYGIISYRILLPLLTPMRAWTGEIALNSQALLGIGPTRLVSCVHQHIDTTVRREQPAMHASLEVNIEYTYASRELERRRAAAAAAAAATTGDWNNGKYSTLPGRRPPPTELLLLAPTQYPESVKRWKCIKQSSFRFGLYSLRGPSPIFKPRMSLAAAPLPVRISPCPAQKHEEAPSALLIDF
ncbi:hypothetical protein EVG20_g2355 [Dentipellis fragilis]|uniref:Uncharacterized protein n=1 Tax=Dentipellis fragilis TaxID=205917 RepID=A0A4Y9Z945_9AGAM|nr:hypothetical protein EVG20_g2355 [Dentipellis fragilis]